MEWVVIGLFVLIPIAALVLWIFALVDCIQVEEDSMYQSGTKLIWVIVIVFATVIGAVVYLAVGRPKPGAVPSIRATPPPPPPPPV
jgi:hypothetical protein